MGAGSAGTGSAGTGSAGTGSAGTGSLADQLRVAFDRRDFDVLGSLLADDVRWGDDDDHPRTCRNRADVLATFRGLLDAGVQPRITELKVGSAGIMCHLTVDWPVGEDRPDDLSLYQVYLVRDGLITKICRFDDRDSAAVMAGLTTPG